MLDRCRFLYADVARSRWIATAAAPAVTTGLWTTAKLMGGSSCPPSPRSVNGWNERDPIRAGAPLVGHLVGLLPQEVESEAPISAGG